MDSPVPSTIRTCRRYKGLKAALPRLGLARIGSITGRIDRHPEAKAVAREGGPYDQWTFKKAGKTPTINLTRNQAQPWTKAIANQRKLKEIRDKMRNQSRRNTRSDNPKRPAPQTRTR